MLFYQKTLIVLLIPLMAAALSGCGEKVGTSLPSTVAEVSETCIRCHESALSSVTKNPITEEWKLSFHNLNNWAGCADCHEPDAGHPTSCHQCHGGTPSEASMSSAVHNPDKSGKCGKCHTAKAGFGFSTFNGVTRNVLTSHFSDTSSSYVSSQNVRACRNCHNPHDTSSRITTLRAWARSGHGRTDAPAWNAYDFKSRAGDCNRCHTTTGFIKYISTGDSTQWGSASDTTKEMLGCNGCHIDYSYALRPANQVTAKYTGGEVTYPDIGTSNLCLNCHVGRASGNTIKNVQRNYTSAAFVNSHYLTAGGIVFGEIGYEYENRDYSDPAGPEEIYRHRYIGTSDSRGNSAAASHSGPCVGCHLANKAQPGEKHTFKPYILTGTSLSPTCETSGCHGATATLPTPRDKAWLQNVLQPRYQAALSSLKYFLATNQYRKLYFNSSNPYFFRDSDDDGVLSVSEVVSSNAQKKWHSVGGPVAGQDISGMNNLGAAFNYNLLIHDRGGVAHNRFYTRRLIYDAIDWLDDNVLNYTVGTTLNGLSGAGDTAFKAEAITYLISAGTNNINIGTSAERY